MTEWQLVKVSENMVAKSDGTFDCIVILVLYFSERVARAHEERIGFGSAFDRAGLASSRALGQQIDGQHAEEFREQGVAAFLRAGLQKRLTVTARGGQAAGKADAFQSDAVAAGSFQHESTHQVMEQEVHANFSFEVFRVFAA